MKKMIAGFVGVLALSGFGLANAAGDVVEKHSKMVKDADWNAMQTVTIKLTEFSYEGPLTFESGKTYKLELKNVGEKKHYFTAPEFFKQVATRKAQVNDQAEIKADHFNAFEILPGGQLDFYFVADTKGEFPVYCTIDDHRDEGMDEVIVVK